MVVHTLRHFHLSQHMNIFSHGVVESNRCTAYNVYSLHVECIYTTPLVLYTCNMYSYAIGATCRCGGIPVSYILIYTCTYRLCYKG